MWNLTPPDLIHQPSAVSGDLIRQPSAVSGDLIHQPSAVSGALPRPRPLQTRSNQDVSPTAGRLLMNAYKQTVSWKLERPHPAEGDNSLQNLITQHKGETMSTDTRPLCPGQMGTVSQLA